MVSGVRLPVSPLCFKMKKQIFVIHGGDSFATYEDYLKSLKDWEIKEKDLFKKNWKGFLQEYLGEDYEVIRPKMPNKQNAKYGEWKIWFEKYIPFLRDNLILVGHSMGGTFLAKYLSENNFPKKIKASLLVAPVYSEDDGRPLVEFALPSSLKNFEKQAGEIFIYHSKDDSVVDFKELSKYLKALPNAKARIFDNHGHFGQENFSEILKDIKELL